MELFKKLFKKNSLKSEQVILNQHHQEQIIDSDLRSWNFNHTHKLQFINAQEFLLPYLQEFYYEKYVAKFYKLPEFNGKNEKNTLSVDAILFLKELDQLQQRDQLFILALGLYLVLDVNVIFTSEILLNEMIVNVKKWQLYSENPNQTTIKFILACYRTWPKLGTVNALHSDKLFLEGISQNFIKNIKESPEMAISFFKENSTEIKKSFSEREYVQLLEPIKDRLPNYYTEGLLDYASHLEYRCSEELNDVIDKLIPIFLDRLSPYHVRPEQLCWYLIKYAEITESWYASSIDYLWEIEKTKSTFDCYSLDNCFYIMKNSVKEASYFPELFNYAKKILNYIKKLCFLDPEEMRKCLDRWFISTLSLGMSENSAIYQNKNNQGVVFGHYRLIEALIEEYSKLLGELFIQDLQAYLQFFERLMCFDKDIWSIRKVVIKEQARFITELEYIVKQTPDNLVQVLSSLCVGRSYRWSYKSEISEGIFSHLMVIDSKIALLAIANELKGDRNDREGKWTPVDIDVNPIYEEMERDQDYCI